MPAFNTQEYVGAAIESILSQTFKDFEFIIVNDGSTDNTPSVLERYKSEDSRIRVFHQKNSGVAASINYACSLARGRYIARMDSDDVCDPRRLARQGGT